MKILVALLTMLGLVLPAVSGARPSHAHASASWKAKMHVRTHTPKVGRKWPVKIVVKTSRGRRLSGTVQYHFLYGGQVVGTRSCLVHGTRPCHFRRGVYRDVIKWPARAAGIRVTFQAVVKTRLGTKKINYWIKVRR